MTKLKEIVVDSSNVKALGVESARFVPVSARICTDQAIRYSFSGQNPQSGFGHVLAADATTTITGANKVRDFRMIAESTTARVAVTLEAE